MDWLDRARCKGLHTDLFYPPLEAKDPNDYYRIAKAICKDCSEWKSCLKDAQTHNDKWGCWGGLTPQERRAPSKVPHGTIEKYRLGCSCSLCIDKTHEDVVQIDIHKVPRKGNNLDINDLLFKLQRNGH